MPNTKKLIVSIFQSKRSGKPTYALVLDLGYTKKFLSFDTSLIAEVLGVSVVDLIGLDYGDYEILVEAKGE